MYYVQPYDSKAKEVLFKDWKSEKEMALISSSRRLMILSIISSLLTLTWISRHLSKCRFFFVEGQDALLLEFDSCD